MSVRQWLRDVELTVSGKAGTLTIRDLKIDFSITKTIGSKNNSATISIWNLTKSHRRLLGEEFDKIELKAGYKGGPVSTIFKGTIEDVEHSKEGADVKSEMTCGDGNEATQKGAVSRTFPAGTKPKEIMEYVIGEMPGVTKGEFKGVDDLPAYKRPVTVYGWAASELDKIGREHKLYWSIQSGEVQAVRNDEVLPGTTVISSETGMIGIPTVTDKGVRVKALLNPNIAPGRQIDVRSDFLDEESGRDKRATDDGGGLFRVSEVTFSGSNLGEEFYVEAEASRVEGGKAVK